MERIKKTDFDISSKLKAIGFFLWIDSVSNDDLKKNSYNFNLKYFFVEVLRETVYTKLHN